MSVAVRYFSRTGNTKTIADAIAEGASSTAVSVDSPDAAKLYSFFYSICSNITGS